MRGSGGPSTDLTTAYNVFESGAFRAPHRDVIRLRSLLVRKRATTSDPVLAFVFRLGDNGIFWKLLGFWPGRVLPPGVRY